MVNEDTNNTTKSVSACVVTKTDAVVSTKHKEGKKKKMMMMVMRGGVDIAVLLAEIPIYVSHRTLAMMMADVHPKRRRRRRCISMKRHAQSRSSTYLDDVCVCVLVCGGE